MIFNKVYSDLNLIVNKKSKEFVNIIIWFLKKKQFTSD